MKETLSALADKYENEEFLVGDPSWFMHQIEGATNKELLAFIASALSYGSRKQFLPKIMSLTKATQSNGRTLLTAPDGGDFADWLVSGGYDITVPPTPSCFYRLYTCQMFNDFLAALAAMVSEYGSIKGYLKAHMQTKDALEAIALITQWFVEHDSKGIIPKPFDCPTHSGENASPLWGSWKGASSCKRVCMFLRWMVRTDSPVDLGLWADIIDRKTLIIPMDTHVVQEAMRLGLLKSKSTSMTNAIRLSQKLAETFPDDPIRGDFALFGLGVDA